MVIYVDIFYWKQMAMWLLTYYNANEQACNFLSCVIVNKNHFISFQRTRRGKRHSCETFFRAPFFCVFKNKNHGHGNRNTRGSAGPNVFFCRHVITESCIATLHGVYLLCLHNACRHVIILACRGLTHCVQRPLKSGLSALEIWGFPWRKISLLLDTRWKFTMVRCHMCNQ